MGQQARGVDRGVHVGQHIADAAELGYRPIELPALLRIGERRLEGGAGDADGLRRDADAAALQIRQGDRQALAALAEQALLRRFGNP